MKLGMATRHNSGILLGVAKKVLAFQIKDTVALPLLLFPVLNGTVMSGAAAATLQP